MPVAARGPRASKSEIAHKAAGLFVFDVLVSYKTMQVPPCPILLAAVAATMMSCGPAPGATSEPGESPGPSSSGEAGGMFPTEGEVTTLGSTSGNGSSSETSVSSSGAFESSTGEPPICHGEPVGVWEAIPDAPESRYVATAVWTGQEVLVWGGLKDFESDFASQGLRYEPATKIWDFISDVDAPIGRSSHVAIWTGSEMFVWGGAITVGERPNTTFEFFADGGRYDPLTDTWKGVSELDAPTARIHHRVVWTGERVLIWGGNNYNEGHTVNTGGSYDPVLDAWKAISLEGARLSVLK